jgi:hypothetical protein
MRTVDTSARTSIPPTPAASGARLEVLRLLARVTFPGLEPWTSSYSTGYGRSLLGLSSCRRGDMLTHRQTRAALAELHAGRLAYRVGLRGWCVSRAGRELAASVFGPALLARESEPDGRGVRSLVEGARVRCACGSERVSVASRVPGLSCGDCGAVFRPRSNGEGTVQP